MLGTTRTKNNEKQIAKRLGKHRETIYLWIKGIQEIGLLGFLDKYRLAKKGKRKRRKVDPIIHRWVLAIRDCEYDCYAQKIQYFLEREKKVYLSVPKIYEIMVEKYIIRSKWKKNKQRGQVPKVVERRQVISVIITVLPVLIVRINSLTLRALTERCGKNVWDGIITTFKIDPHVKKW